MELRRFGSTDMELSVLGLGGLLARYEGALGHPPPEEKRRIYLRAAELGINLFDMGYGDEVHIPDELKGESDERHFSLKMGAPDAKTLADVVDGHLRNIRRERIDILRVHHANWMTDVATRDVVGALRDAGKVRSLCLIRHYEADQLAYAETGPESDADADLVIYNYACRWQAPGLDLAHAAGKGVLIMKALGGQWLPWDEQVRMDWSKAGPDDVIRLSPKGEDMRSNMPLVYPIVNGPWHELCEPGEEVPPTHRAIGWVQDNDAVTSVLVAFASIAELEEGVGAAVMKT
ncbi:MAG: aldo/keto reductase [Candidatus Latescibacterota bacterium]|nr:aldo/keto reductase [Candidatus Latescibacterota bacterium]